MKCTRGMPDFVARFFPNHSCYNYIIALRLISIEISTNWKRKCTSKYTSYYESIFVNPQNSSEAQFVALNYKIVVEDDQFPQIDSVHMSFKSDRLKGTTRVNLDFDQILIHAIPDQGQFRKTHKLWPISLKMADAHLTQLLIPIW